MLPWVLGPFQGTPPNALPVLPHELLSRAWPLGAALTPAKPAPQSIDRRPTSPTCAANTRLALRLDGPPRVSAPFRSPRSDRWRSGLCVHLTGPPPLLAPNTCSLDHLAQPCQSRQERTEVPSHRSLLAADKQYTTSPIRQVRSLGSAQITGPLRALTLLVRRATSCLHERSPHAKSRRFFSKKTAYFSSSHARSVRQAGPLD